MSGNTTADNRRPFVVSHGYHLDLKSRWLNADGLEQAICSCGEPFASNVKAVSIKISPGCSVMVDAAVRLLSLANQLVFSGRRVSIDFVEGEAGAMGYLNRLGFFDLLHPAIDTTPSRPTRSGAELYGGTNPNIVEFKKVHPKDQDGTIPSVLADHLEKLCNNRSDKTTLGLAAFTVFAELIQNIWYHSNTKVDGYAALQVYRKQAFVVVSDSGDGLLQTLRPTLQDSRLASLSDPELIVRMLNEGGLSRHGDGRGAGLQAAAEHAIKYRAELSIRLPESSLSLIPGTTGYSAVARGVIGLPAIRGTHFAFKFHLDNPN